MNDYEIQKRKYFQRIKHTTNEQFWSEMNRLHSQAYFKAITQLTEAAEITLTPKQRKAMFDKANEIREQWDSMSELDSIFSELTLTDILKDVQKEMARATGIHGPKYDNWIHAKESIAEEWQEVIEAVEAGDKQHAYVEAVQLIGVIVKGIRQLDELVSEVNVG